MIFRDMRKIAGCGFIDSVLYTRPCWFFPVHLAQKIPTFYAFQRFSMLIQYA
jgi:hypothetical protein